MESDAPKVDRAAAERAMVAFGEKIRAAIGTKKIAPIARRIGIERSNLSAAKAGKRLLTADQLVALAQHLKVGIDDLLPSAEEGRAEEDRIKRARVMWAGRPNAGPRLVDPPLSGPSTTLDPGERRGPGLGEWLNKHWRDVTYRELWNLERWVAQDALDPESEDYWTDAHAFIKRRLASRGGRDR